MFLSTIRFLPLVFNAVGFSLLLFSFALSQSSPSPETEDNFLITSFCGITPDENDDDAIKSYFNSFIFQGDAFTDILLNTLSSLVGDKVAKLYLQEIESNPGGATSLRGYLLTGLFVIFCIGSMMVIMWILGSLMAFSGRWWQRKTDAQYLTTKFSLNEDGNPAKMHRLYVMVFVVGFLFLAAACVAILFAVKFPFSVTGFFCQLGRFIHEIKNGVMYRQDQATPRWLPPLEPNVTFDGTDSHKKYMTTLRETFTDNDEKPTVFEQVDDVLNGVEIKVNQIVRDANQALQSVVVPYKRRRLQAAVELLVHRPALAQLSASEDVGCEEVGEAVHNIVVSLETNVAGGKVEVEATVESMSSGLTTVDEQFKILDRELEKFRGELVSHVPRKETVQSASKAAMIIIFSIIIISLIGLTLICLLIFKIRRKFTRLQLQEVNKVDSVQVNRNRGIEVDGRNELSEEALLNNIDVIERETNEKSAKQFKSVSKWFTFSGATLFSFGGTAMLLLSFTNSICMILKHAVSDTSSLLKYKHLEPYYPKNGSPELKRILDHCFSDPMQTDFIDSYMSDTKVSYGESMDKLETASVRVRFPLEQIAKISPVLESMKALGGTIMPNFALAESHANLFFARPDILLSGTEPKSTTLQDALSLQYLRETVGSLNGNKANQFPNWSDKYKYLDTAVIYGMEDHLSAVQELSLEFQCANLRFCVLFQREQDEICSREGRTKVMMQYNVFSNPPEWKRSGFFRHFRHEFANTLQEASCMNLDAEDSTVESERAYKYNSFLVGLYFASQKVLLMRQTEPGDQNPAQAAIILGSMEAKFDNATKLAADDLHRALTRGEEVLNSNPPFNCRAFLTSAASVIDGLCGGIQQDVFWISTCWSIMAGLSSMLWFLCYKLYRHFSFRAEVQQEFQHFRENSGWGQCVKHGNAESVKQALLLLDPDARDKFNNSVLHCAAYMGDVHLCQAVLDRGMNIDAKNQFGCTPLSVAAAQRQYEVISFLMERGADPALLDNFGDTPLHSAARAGNLKLAKSVCGEGARNPVWVDNEGALATHVAEYHEHRTVKTFLENMTSRVTMASFSMEDSSITSAQTPDSSLSNNSSSSSVANNSLKKIS